MMTVSRVMHNAESVRPATRDRVLQAIQTLNYVPDLSARKMRAQGRKPSTLAVLAQDTVPLLSLLIFCLPLSKPPASSAGIVF